MSQATHAAASAQLLDAYATGVPITPLTEQFAGFDLSDAYAVQTRQVQLWTERGRTVVGRKVGLTSRAMQEQLGVDEPDDGVILGDRSYPSGCTVDTAALISPRVEPEIAFVLGTDLTGPGITVQDALAAVATVHAALEVIDSRVADWRIRLADTVADNASFGACIMAPTGVPATSLDLAAVEVVMSRNGRLCDRGISDAVLGNPLNALVWLANTLAQRDTALRTGDIVLPGSITAATPVQVGDSIVATFTGIGAVTAQFG